MALLCAQKWRPQEEGGDLSSSVGVHLSLRTTLVYFLDNWEVTVWFVYPRFWHFSKPNPYQHLYVIILIIIIIIIALYL